MTSEKVMLNRRDVVRRAFARFGRSAGPRRVAPRGDRVTPWPWRVSRLTLALALTCGATLGGCRDPYASGTLPLVGPYEHTRTWAVAPLRNESGSQQVDPTRLADQMAGHLQNADRIVVLPVNRTLAAMQSLQLSEVRSRQDALSLLERLDADGLVVGTVSHYDPYDPPAIGLSVELYTSRRYEQRVWSDLRELSRAARGPQADQWPGGAQPDGRPRQPVTALAAHLDASDPGTRRNVQRYGLNRSAHGHPEDWRLFRLSMDLYTEFATYVMSWRLLRAEAQRLHQPPPEPNGDTRVAAAP